MLRFRISEFFDQKSIDSTAEYMVLLALLKYARDKEYEIDLSDLVINEKLYHENAVNKGMQHIYDILVNDNNLEDLPSYFDINLVEMEKGVLYDDRCKDVITWTFELALENCPNPANMAKHEYIIYLMLMLIARHLDRIKQGLETRKLVFDLGSKLSTSDAVFMPIIILKSNNPWLDEYVDVFINKQFVKGDAFDFVWGAFYRKAKDLNTLGEYTITEKLDLMKKYDMRPGDILGLYIRENISAYRPAGDIKNAHIVRVVNITDQDIQLETISMCRTKEETYKQYNNFTDKQKERYGDILYAGLNRCVQNYPICSLGIEGYFSITVVHNRWNTNYKLPEDKLLCRLDPNTYTELLVTRDGVVETCRMREVDAVYWILCQYGINFDKERYVSMYYKENEKPLYETVDPTPVLA